MINSSTQISLSKLHSTATRVLRLRSHYGLLASVGDGEPNTQGRLVFIWTLAFLSLISLANYLPRTFSMICFGLLHQRCVYGIILKYQWPQLFEVRVGGGNIIGLVSIASKWHWWWSRPPAWKGFDCSARWRTISSLGKSKENKRKSKSTWYIMYTKEKTTAYALKELIL